MGNGSDSGGHCVLDLDMLCDAIYSFANPGSVSPQMHSTNLVQYGDNLQGKLDGFTSPRQFHQNTRGDHIFISKHTAGTRRANQMSVV